MALGRRRITSIRLVLRDDPAIDHSKSDYDAYVESCYQRKHLTLHNGDKATEFELKPMTFAQREALPDYDNTATYVMRCALKSVSNYIVYDDETDTESTLRPVEHTKVDGSPMVTVKWLAEAALPTDQVVPIITAINEITQAKAPLSERSVPASGQDTPSS